MIYMYCWQRMKTGLLCVSGFARHSHLCLLTGKPETGLGLIFLNLIKENTMKALFAGALREPPIKIKWSPSAVRGPNKHSGLLSENTAVIETAGISLKHEIVFHSASTASNERRGARSVANCCSYLLITWRNLHKRRRQGAKAASTCQMSGADTVSSQLTCSTSFVRCVSLSGLLSCFTPTSLIQPAISNFLTPPLC